jgi:transcriptional regulator with XRE-family HTH domain
MSRYAPAQEKMLRNETKSKVRGWSPGSLCARLASVHRNNRIYQELVSAAKLARSDVARILRVSRSTVMRYANNSIVPEDSKLLLLAEKTNQVVTIQNETIAPSRMADDAVSNATLTTDVMRALRKLPPSKQHDLLVAMRHMIQAASPPVNYGQSDQTPLTDASDYGNETASPTATEKKDPVAMAKGLAEKVRRGRSARDGGKSAS